MKTAKGDLRFSFRDPIYDYETIVVVTNDMKWWDKEYPDADSEGEPCRALCIQLKKKRNVIVVTKNSPLSEIQHEIGHAARKVMSHIGFNITAENDEPLAYYEEWVTKMVHKGLNRLLDKQGIKRK